MRTRTPTHIWKHLLPALVLLMVLAQLATSAHWHWGEHSVVDCGLFSVQGHADDTVTTTALSIPSNTTPIKISSALQLSLPLLSPRRESIRAPPVHS